MALTAERLREALRGVIAFPVTPYTSRGEIDANVVRTNANWLATSGVNAIVAPSGTGELYALTPTEIAQVIRLTVEAVAGRLPVIAGVGFGPRVAAELATEAESSGADGILVLPPYYATPDPIGLSAYYATVARATSLGVLPYMRDGAMLTPDQTLDLARTLGNVIGLKDGRGDIRLFQRIRHHVVENLGTERFVWLAGAGDDIVAPYFAAGAEGFTSSIACFWPDVAVALCRQLRNQDYEGAARLSRDIIQPIYGMRSRRHGYEVSVTKAAVEILGVPVGPARPPLANLTEAEHAELRALLARLGAPRMFGSAAAATSPRAGDPG